MMIIAILILALNDCSHALNGEFSGTSQVQFFLPFLFSLCFVIDYLPYYYLPFTTFQSYIAILSISILQEEKLLNDWRESSNMIRFAFFSSPERVYFYLCIANISKLQPFHCCSKRSPTNFGSLKTEGIFYKSFKNSQTSYP